MHIPKRGMGKRGMDDKLAFTMWEIIVVLMVIIALTVSVRGIANNTVYWKKYHSTDLALMTDLAMVNQGDFIINYELKDYNRNIITKTAFIDPLRLHIILRDSGYQVYDGSEEDDKFPQAYLFARDADIIIEENNLTSDYLVLYKEGNRLGLRNNLISSVNSCPSLATKADLSQKHFTVSSIDSKYNSYAQYLDGFLKTVGTHPSNKESMIILGESNLPNIVIYYDPSSGQKSEKLACILRREMLDKNPDMKVLILPFDSAVRSDNLAGRAGGYNYWIYIALKDSMTDEDLGDYLKDAITEYYE